MSAHGLIVVKEDDAHSVVVVDDFMKFVCVCVCVISFTTIRSWAFISLLSQLDAAAPESSYPLGDKPVNQPALSQTLVGYSVNVVHQVEHMHVSVVLSVTLYRAT